jgi:hypothetical protein
MWKIGFNRTTKQQNKHCNGNSKEHSGFCGGFVLLFSLVFCFLFSQEQCLNAFCHIFYLSFHEHVKPFMIIACPGHVDFYFFINSASGMSYSVSRYIQFVVSTKMVAHLQAKTIFVKWNNWHHMTIISFNVSLHKSTFLLRSIGQ